MGGNAAWEIQGLARKGSLVALNRKFLSSFPLVTEVPAREVAGRAALSHLQSTRTLTPQGPAEEGLLETADTLLRLLGAGSLAWTATKPPVTLAQSTNSWIRPLLI